MNGADRIKEEVKYGASIEPPFLLNFHSLLLFFLWIMEMSNGDQRGKRPEENPGDSGRGMRMILRMMYIK